MDKVIILDETRLYRAADAKAILVRGQCRACRGSGEIDTSYHGSACWEPCGVCEGSGVKARPLELQDTGCLLRALLLGAALADLLYHEPTSDDGE